MFPAVTLCTLRHTRCESMESRNPRTPATSVLVTTAAFVVVVAGMRAAQPIVVPSLLAVFIAILSAPALFWLEARRIPRPLALLLVVAAIIAAGFLLTALLGTSLRDFSRDLPLYKARLSEQTLTAVAWLQGRGLEVSREDVIAQLDPGAAMQLVADVFNGFRGVLAQAFLIFLMVLFILLEASSFPRKLESVLDDPRASLARFGTFSENLKRYLAIKSTASVGTGLVIGVWLSLLGVDYPVLWGVLAFLLNYVPNIGSVIAAVPAVMFAWIQLGPAAALWSGVGFAVVNVVVGSLIEPRFMGRGLGLSPLVVFLSLVFWGWVLGPVGMFLSVPLTMTVQIALDSREDTHWIAVLLGPGSAVRRTPASAPASATPGATTTDTDD